jgi:hypothetical protein
MSNNILDITYFVGKVSSASDYVLLIDVARMNEQILHTSEVKFVAAPVYYFDIKYLNIFSFRHLAKQILPLPLRSVQTKISLHIRAV